jgi:hypothetical protein
MPELASRISDAFSESNCEPWFPRLTPYLTSCAWKRLRKETGINPGTYSTARVLGRSLSIPRNFISVFESSISPETLHIVVEGSGQGLADCYLSAGVDFYSGREIETGSVLACLADALNIIRLIPTLLASVNSLVRSIHVIRPPDAEHDVSFSEPHIPFSIFISVFEERLPNDDLRVAEAIVHEAMHLQLTMIENVMPLVSRQNIQYYSPWRQEYRNAQSLLHGLYVFRVIATFLEQLQAVSESVNYKYASSRLKHIAEEINQTRMFSQCPELTTAGGRLVNRLLRNQ